MDQLNEMTTKLDEGFDRLAAEIESATVELKAYLRKMQFENVGSMFFFLFYFKSK